MQRNTSLNLKAGELVEVRSKTEILATLDVNGRLDGLPFMPEMLQFCGKRLRVYKRAHKTCDFVTGTGIRKLNDAVHLENVRCDGSAHGNCLAACLIFWKDAWLKRVPDGDFTRATPEQDRSTREKSCEGHDREPFSELALWRATRADDRDRNESDPTYACQATLLPDYTQPMSPWDVRQYVEDYCSGNVTSVRNMFSRFAFRMYDNLINLGIGAGPVLRWTYDVCARVFGTNPYPGRTGKIQPGSKTPTQTLQLKPGEIVRVKPLEAILETVDSQSKNRGMSFSAEMAPYCGGTYRVKSRVDRLIDEKTGKMLTMKNSCVILDGVICRAQYNKRMIFCPRATLPYWREIWLERVENDSAAGEATCVTDATGC